MKLLVALVLLVVACSLTTAYQVDRSSLKHLLERLLTKQLLTKQLLRARNEQEDTGFTPITTFPPPATFPPFTFPPFDHGTTFNPPTPASTTFNPPTTDSTTFNPPTTDSTTFNPPTTATSTTSPPPTSPPPKRKTCFKHLIIKFLLKKIMKKTIKPRRCFLCRILKRFPRPHRFSRVPKW